MFAVAFGGGRQSQHFGLGEGAEREHVGEFGLASGEGAGLVEEHRVGAGQRFDDEATADEEAAFGGGADGGQHGHRG